jgi:hypothetical protein
MSITVKLIEEYNTPIHDITMEDILFHKNLNDKHNEKNEQSSSIESFNGTVDDELSVYGDTPITHSTTSSLTFSKETTNKNSRVTRKNVNAPTNIRLNRTFTHYPVVPNGKNAIGQLHAYETRERIRGKNVIHCEGCHVNLCLDCFKSFHTQDIIHNEQCLH